MRVIAKLLMLSLLTTPVWADGNDPAPIPQEVIDKVVARPLESGGNLLPLRVEQKLDATLEQLDRLERSRISANLTQADAASLSVNSRDFEALRLEARSQLTAARSRLLKSGLTSQVKKLDAMAVMVEDRFERVAQALGSLHNAKDDAGRKNAKEQLKGVLRKLHKPEDPTAFQHPITTFGYDVPLKSKPQQPATDLPGYLALGSPRGVQLAFNGDLLLLAGTPPVTPPEATQCSYTAADLDKSATAQFEVRATPEITALADSLDYSPVKIYKWVYDNIAYEPYYGSLKGAQGALLSRAGNDTDQASLLIALLRVSNIPARYVKGQVWAMDATSAGANAKIAKWLGAKSYDAAANMLSQGRNPSVGFITNASSQKIGVSFVHVWVEACVPYAHYRGARVDTSGNRWIPLDPAFKEKTYQAGIATNVSFDYNSYLANRKNGPDSLPHEAYAQQVETSIKSSNANATLEDVPYSGRTNPMRIDVMPASLPFSVNQFLAWAGSTSAETSSLPDSHRYKFSIKVSNSANTQLAATTLQLPEHILKRITLSPKGATAADQTALDSWRLDGSVSSAAPCTINTLPVVKSEGVDVVAGTAAVGLCTTNNRLNLQMLLPELAAGDCNSVPASAACLNGVTYTNIGAANYHALQAYGFQASNQHLAARGEKLLAAVRNIANPNTNLEETEGEYLNLVGLKYMRYFSDANKTVGRLDGGSGESGNHLGLISSQMKVAYLFDLPFAVNRSGFLVDVPGGRSRNVDLTSGALVYKTFLLSGYSASAYESYIWQENSRMDAVSTVRGIQYARETGIEVLTLTTANWSVAGDTACANTTSQCYKFTHNTNAALNYSTAEVNAIKANYIDDGRTVTIPRSLILYNNWKGSVYVAEKNALPTSAQASFIIGGTYAGGYTTTTPLIFSYSPTLNTGYFNPSTVPSTANPLGLPLITIGGGGVGNGRTHYNSWAGDPVNMVTGNVYHTERDISIPGRGGLPIVFERSYNSRAATLDTTCAPMGCGRTHSFNHYLKFYGVEGGMAKVSWVDGTGGEKFFSTTAHTNGDITLGTTLSNPPGIFATFKREASGVYTLREKNGLTYTFANVAGTSTGGQRARMDKIVDANGNTLNLVYDASNQLTQVKDTVGASGRALTFTYTGGRITQITDFASPVRSYQYSYEADGDLASFKNPLAVSSPATQPPVNYAYYTTADGANLNHALKTYTLPRGNGMKFEYYADSRAFRHSTLACATAATSPTCQVNTFTYNDFRREAVQVSERGYARRFFFDQYGNPLQIVEENGATHDYTYDAANPYNRLSKIDALGYKTLYAYDASGNVTSITTPRLATVTFDNYNTFNQPQRVKDARGNYTVMKYDAKGNLLESIKLKTGIVPVIPYTPVATDVIAWTINTYGAYGNLLTAKPVKNAASPAGQGPVITYAYDANSLYPTSISRTGDKNGDGVSDAADTKTLVYDIVGRVTTDIDADWHTTTFVYDTVDRVTSGTDAIGKPRSYSYDQNGNLTENKLVISAVTYDRAVYSYDLSDRRTQVTDFGNGSGNAVSTTVYDATGNLVKITDPDGFSLGFEYDEANRAVRAFDKEGNHVYMSRDIDGKPKCTRDPNGNAVFYTYWDKTRDGRLKRVTAPSANACPGSAPTTGVRAVEYDYDANGNVIATTEIGSDNTTRTHFTSYDELNRPVQAIGPTYTDATLGSIRPVTQYSYNLLGHLTQVQAGYCASSTTGCAAAAVLSPQLTTVADDFGRKIKETDANGKFWSTSYDINNNPTQITDAKGQLTAMSWNYGHLLATRTNLAAGNVALTYNNLGQVQTANTKTAGSATTDLINYSSTYDSLNRLNTITDNRGGIVLDYDFSPGGLLNKFKDSHGNETNYVYDAVGRLASLWAPNYGTVSYRYDAGGRLLEKWLPNGVSARYTYNADNTLASLINRRTSTAIISQHSYLYDAYANRRQQVETINGAALTNNYTYDSLNRLLTAANGTVTQDQGYSYDPLNNLTSKTLGTPVTATTNYTYDVAHQLLETRDATSTLLSAFVLDANGALTKKCEGGTVTRTATDCSGTTVTSLSYDPLNRLTQAVKGATTESYAYDEQGRRIRKISGATTTNYLYTGPDIHAEYGTAYTTPNAITVHGPNDDDPIMRLTGTGTAAVPTYYHQDGLGSVVATSSSTGTVAASQRFDAWGNVLSASGAIAQYGYTGREPDATGLIYYRARYYDPTIGRFTQRDPIGLAGGINRYAYVGNNPVNYTDPRGLFISSFSSINAGSFLGSGGGASKGASNTSSSVYAALDQWFSLADLTAGRQSLGGSSWGSQGFGSSYTNGWPSSWYPDNWFADTRIQVAAAVPMPAPVVIPDFRLPAPNPWWLLLYPTPAGEGSDIIPPGPYFNDKSRQSKPDGCPTGTIPIDQAKGKFKWDKDDVHKIKKRADANPTDWTGVSPNGHIWTGDGKGNAVDNGHWTGLIK
ncbi:MAG: type IV secretion protein Rhs [Gammaproteobacteria bacterium]|nr:type IV secretion protein Rhs [Gammaproteobacteria bacterium]